MSARLRIISSMATKQVLAELVARFERTSSHRVSIESVGGVDAARRVHAGEAFDAVVLAANAIEQLIAAGRIVAGSRVDLVNSGVAVAVRAGGARPDIGTEDSLKRAVLAAPSIGFSTGPSGVQLAKLFERWGITEQIKGRIVQAPPGVPVGTLVAQGEVALGFQQLSELMNLAGIDLLGPLPAAVQIITTFSGGMPVTSTQADAVREMLTFMASPATSDVKRRNGMAPA